MKISKLQSIMGNGLILPVTKEYSQLLDECISPKLEEKLDMVFQKKLEIVYLGKYLSNEHLNKHYISDQESVIEKLNDLEMGLDDYCEYYVISPFSALKETNEMRFFDLADSILETVDYFYPELKGRPVRYHWRDFLSWVMRSIESKQANDLSDDEINRLCNFPLMKYCIANPALLSLFYNLKRMREYNVNSISGNLNRAKSTNSFIKDDQGKWDYLEFVSMDNDGQCIFRSTQVRLGLLSCPQFYINFEEFEKKVIF